MIHIITGQRGSGKTMLALDLLMRAAKSGLPVYTDLNVPGINSSPIGGAWRVQEIESKACLVHFDEPSLSSFSIKPSLYQWVVQAPLRYLLFTTQFPSAVVWPTKEEKAASGFLHWMIKAMKREGGRCLSLTVADETTGVLFLRRVSTPPFGIAEFNPMI